MDPMSSLADTAAYYEGFARDYAKGESPTYLDWSLGVAADEEVLGRLDELPPPRRQPNLLFAAARHHGAPAPGPFAAMRQTVLERWSEVSETMRTRYTQTNEPGRCATLLPALDEIADGGALALLEVGVSGGLCLYPDRYSYRYLDGQGSAVATAGDGRPTFDCVVSGRLDPFAVPEVTWRGGIDLNPLDVTDPETLAWLRVLVWPEHEDRLDRLDAAVAQVGALPRTMASGDASGAALGELMAQARAAAPQARLVVFHTAVAAYFDDALRERWPQHVTSLCREHDAVWLSNEAPEVLPGVAATAPGSPPRGTFCLGVDGRARAWTHGHGRSMTVL